MTKIPVGKTVEFTCALTVRALVPPAEGIAVEFA